MTVPHNPNSATSFTSTDSTTSEAELLPQCFVSGECQGDLIGIFADIAGADDCLVACKNTSGCVWFTEFEVILPCRHPTLRNDASSILLQYDTCGMFRNCLNIDEQTCPSCISGKLLIRQIRQLNSTKFCQLGHYTCELQVCNMPGQCEGTFIHLEMDVTNQQECQARAQINLINFMLSKDMRSV